MKKLISILVLSIGTLFVSAQSLMLITNISKPSNGEAVGADNITDRIGVGYQIKNNVIVGFQSAPGDNGCDMFLRYLCKENIYTSLRMPTKEASNNIKIGVGCSLNISKNLYLEPNYNIPLRNESNGGRDGDFDLGLSYRF